MTILWCETCDPRPSDLTSWAPGSDIATLNQTPVHDGTVVIPTFALPGVPIPAIDATVGFSDPDGDTLTYSAYGLPEGLDIDPVTGIISGTFPADWQDGVYEITVVADDGKGGSAASQPIVINLERPNAAPVYTGGTYGPFTLTEPQPFSINYGLLFTDPDNDPLTFTAAGLPPGWTIDPATGVVSGTSGPTGTYLITVTANDGTFPVAAPSFAVIFTQFTIPANLAPVYAGPDPLAPVQYPDGATITPIDMSVGWSDPEGNLPITYTADVLPAGLVIDGLTGIISGTLSPVGTDTITNITVTATDSLGAAAQAPVLVFTVTNSGTWDSIAGPDWSSTTGTWDGTEFWI